MSAVLPPLSARSVSSEVMDRPNLGAGELRRALGGLARLNWWSGAARPFRRPLGQLASTLHGRPVRVLDVGSGGGEVPAAVASWLGRRSRGVELTLCDINPATLGIALERMESRGVAAGGLVHDVTTGPLPDGFDAVTSSLFLHHLEWEQAVAVLRHMARAAGSLLVVCDLRRSLVGLALAGTASRLLTASPVVRTDALLSVRAAFTVNEVRRLAREAGLDGAVIDRCWPQRWRLTWWKR